MKKVESKIDEKEKSIRIICRASDPKDFEELIKLLDEARKEFAASLEEVSENMTVTDEVKYLSQEATIKAVFHNEEIFQQAIAELDDLIAEMNA